MKLSELVPIPTPVAEATNDANREQRLAALKDSIKDELDADDAMAEKIVDYLINNNDPEGVDDFLYNAFESEMPYNVMTDDPSNWIADHMSHLFKDEMKGL